MYSSSTSESALTECPHHRLWTDEQNLKFVEELYPWFLKVFLLLSHIMKADAARYMYMHHYGGAVPLPVLSPSLVG